MAQSQPTEKMFFRASCGKKTDKDDLTIDNINDIINNKSNYKKNDFLLEEKAKKFIVNKNMFLAVSNSPLKKDLVYEQYGFAEELQDYAKHKKGEVVKYKNKFYVCVKDVEEQIKWEQNFEDSEYWEEKTDIVFKGNLYKEKTDMNYWETIDINLLDHKISNIFSIKEENSKKYLSIKLYDEIDGKYLFDKDNTRSIQYWYLYKGSLQFVFGANLPDKEKDYAKYQKVWEKDKEIKIYISMLSTRDTRVYDDMHKEIGNVYNQAKDNTAPYGVQQIYKLKNIDTKFYRLLVKPEITPYIDVFDYEGVTLQDHDVLSNHNSIIIKRILNEDIVNNVTYLINGIEYNDDEIKIEEINSDLLIEPALFDYKIYHVKNVDIPIEDIEMKKTSSKYGSGDVGKEINDSSKYYFNDEISIGVRKDYWEEYNYILNGEEFSALKTAKFIISKDINLKLKNKKFKSSTLNFSVSGPILSAGITRISSLNTEAELKSLNDGDTIYYGDVLRLSYNYNPNDTKVYAYNTMNPLGDTYYNGSEITVDENFYGVTIVCQYLPGWHVLTTNYRADITSLGGMDQTGSFIQLPLGAENYSNIRLSGTLYSTQALENSSSSQTVSGPYFSDVTFPTTINGANDSAVILGNFTNNIMGVPVVTASIIIGSYSDGMVDYKVTPSHFVFSKIEFYVNDSPLNPFN